VAEGRQHNLRRIANPPGQPAQGRQGGCKRHERQSGPEKGPEASAGMCAHESENSKRFYGIIKILFVLNLSVSKMMP
jgi:hypothetical protein